ncbi:MAG: 4-hydroxy-tetrahydrodipicolinate reductase [Haliangiales bacterium]
MSTAGGASGPTRVCVVGPGGRMGRAVLELAIAADDVTVSGALVAAHSELLGAEVAPGVQATDDPERALATADVYVDFSAPAATAAIASRAATDAVAGVIGTTGLDAAEVAAIEALAARAPTIWAPNFSPGVNVLLALAETAARALGPEFDIEVVELHHRNKRDAPSGTALALVDALAAGRASGDPEAPALVTRAGRAGDVGPRPDDEIGALAVRGGDVIGEHTAYLLGQRERIELTHRASSRALFAEGALRAARWAVGRPPGRYQMRDVLGL